MKTCLAILLAVGCFACSRQPAPPTAPSAPIPPAPVMATPMASLAIEQTSLIVRPCSPSCGTDRFLYEPRFQLRETSGKSGATIQYFGINGGDSTGPACWLTALRVAPGGTLDTFYSDEGWNWLGYCGVWGAGKTAAGTVHVIVGFTDDNGIAGAVAADVSGGT